MQARLQKLRTKETSQGFLDPQNHRAVLSGQTLVKAVPSQVSCPTWHNQQKLKKGCIRVIQALNVFASKDEIDICISLKDKIVLFVRTQNSQNPNFGVVL